MIPPQVGLDQGEEGKDPLSLTGLGQNQMLLGHRRPRERPRRGVGLGQGPAAAATYSTGHGCVMSHPRHAITVEMGEVEQGIKNSTFSIYYYYLIY